jgi:hypothetical protein
MVAHRNDLKGGPSDMNILIRLTAAAAALASLAACDALGLNRNETAGRGTNTVSMNTADANAVAPAAGGKDPAAGGASASAGGQVTTAFLENDRVPRRRKLRHARRKRLLDPERRPPDLPGLVDRQRPDLGAEPGHDHADQRRRDGRTLDPLQLILRRGASPPTECEGPDLRWEVRPFRHASRGGCRAFIAGQTAKAHIAGLL